MKNAAFEILLHSICHQFGSNTPIKIQKKKKSMKNIGSLKNNLRLREFSGILIFCFYILNISIITLRYSYFLLCIIAIHTLSQPLYYLLGLMTRFKLGHW